MRVGVQETAFGRFCPAHSNTSPLQAHAAAAEVYLNAKLGHQREDRSPWGDHFALIIVGGAIQQQQLQQLGLTASPLSSEQIPSTLGSKC